MSPNLDWDCVLIGTHLAMFRIVWACLNLAYGSLGLSSNWGCLRLSQLTLGELGSRLNLGLFSGGTLWVHHIFIFDFFMDFLKFSKLGTNFQPGYSHYPFTKAGYTRVAKFQPGYYRYPFTKAGYARVTQKIQVIYRECEGQESGLWVKLMHIIHTSYICMYVCM